MADDVIAGQISLFAEEDDAERDRYMLRMALKYGGFEGARVRIFAALTFPQFQQYAHLFLQHEMENGGGTIPGQHRGYRKGEASGLTVTCYETQPFSSRKYTWKACAKEIREMIDEGEWLLKDEEFEIGRIVDVYHGLPYPRSRLKYPETAWGVVVSEKEIWDHRADL